jgi:type II secretory pathway component GspD/PulD (secretin)
MLAHFRTNIVINPTNVLDPQQNAENHYSRQWADDGSLRGKEHDESGPLWRASTTVNPADLETKHFQIGVAAFRANVRVETGESDPVLGFKELVANAGVDLSPPKYAALISERFGVLEVSATKKDLAIIQGVINDLHCPPPQIHIKARFLEVPQKIFANLQELYLQQGMTNGIARLTNPQFQVFLHAAQQPQGVQELAEPEAVTIAGRQVLMKAVIIQPIVTNYALVASTTRHGPKFYPQVAQFETGPILDVVPMALPDGYTISLRTIASVIQFLGYANPKGLASHVVTNRDGDKIELPAVLPQFQVKQASAEQSIYDGQTLVLYGQDEKTQIANHIQKPGEEYKFLIVLVTATFIDPAGNRVHSDGEMPFAQTQFPPPWP